MMRSLSDIEEYRFFDAHEDIASVSDSAESSDYSSDIDNSKLNNPDYEVWKMRPLSVQERRFQFLNSIGLNSDFTSMENPKGEVDRIMNNGGAVLRTSTPEEEFSSSRTSASNWSEDGSHLVEESSSDFCRFENSDGGTVFSDQLETVHELGSVVAPSTSAHQVNQRDFTATTSSPRKKRWWSKLRSVTCTVDGKVKADNLRPNGCEARVQRVKVQQCRKKTKELSALFTGQDIQAHDGPILAMEFSPDGQYLASAGADGIVRVWQVLDDLRSNETDIPDIDPTCIYFTVNHLSELEPLIVEKEKLGLLKSLRKSADSACVIFPPKVFRITEKPLHEFHGHGGEILDLSWSNNNYLLSSSVDKTARLWQVGSDHCLKVFSHSNYVTCIQFNPVDENFFISGSIDGKVRIWAISCCQVVDWIDIGDIVTAVCYYPDGKGGVVGSLTGSCRFYNISDNRFQLEARVGLHSKKKASGKRITGFQFLPQDPSKLMVTCADSQVKILHGINVIGKYRGMRGGGNQTFASFTSNGKHIISACEDSHVYLWDFTSHEDSSASSPKKIKSFERFSANASVAVTWSGLKFSDSSRNGDQNGQNHAVDRSSAPTLPPFSSPTCFSLGQEFVLESFPKGSATWPEEKLPSPHMPSAIRKAQYKFLKASCQSTSTSHAWGLVIVTAGWDGRIKSFHNYGLPVHA